MCDDCLSTSQLFPQQPAPTDVTGCRAAGASNGWTKTLNDAERSNVGARPIRLFSFYAVTNPPRASLSKPPPPQRKRLKKGKYRGICSGPVGEGTRGTTIF